MVLLSRFVVNIREASRGGNNWWSNTTHASDIVSAEPDRLADCTFSSAARADAPNPGERPESRLSNDDDPGFYPLPEIPATGVPECHDAV